MPSNPRKILAEQQARLVGALNQSAAVPPGFDPSQLETAAQSLRRKRLRSVEKVWPGLCAALGDQFIQEFDAYTRERTPPADPSADARRFGRWLATRHPFSDQVRVELAVARLVPLVPSVLRLAGTNRLLVLLRVRYRLYQFRVPLTFRAARFASQQGRSM